LVQGKRRAVPTTEIGELATAQAMMVCTIAL
jgi:hypothetical protein